MKTRRPSRMPGRCPRSTYRRRVRGETPNTRAASDTVSPHGQEARFLLQGWEVEGDRPLGLVREDLPRLLLEERQDQGAGFLRGAPWSGGGEGGFGGEAPGLDEGEGLLLRDAVGLEEAQEPHGLDPLRVPLPPSIIET